MSKAERLLDLVIALLNSRRFRSAIWIRERVAGYQDAASDDAFFRMFERDKRELRDLGIPIETESLDDGYRILPGDFALPPLSFTPAESAALAVASRLWETTVLGDAQSAAMRKVRDGGALSSEEAHGPVQPWLQARLRTVEPTFGDVFAALRAGRALRFDYRGPSDAVVATRHMQPWGVVNHHGAWYVVGFDLDRAAQRTFRLSRMVGSAVAVAPAAAAGPPEDVDLTQAVVGGIEREPVTPALLRIKPGAAIGLRRRGTVLRDAESEAGVDGSGRTGRSGDGHDDVRIVMSSLTDTARHVASHGADVQVIDPPELRAAVRTLLTGAIEQS